MDGIPDGGSCDLHVAVVLNGRTRTADVRQPADQHSNSDGTYGATYEIPASLRGEGYDTLAWTVSCEVRDRQQPQYVVSSRTLPTQTFQGQGSSSSSPAPSPTPTPLATGTPGRGTPGRGSPAPTRSQGG